MHKHNSDFYDIKINEHSILAKTRFLPLFSPHPIFIPSPTLEHGKEGRLHGPPGKY